MNKKDIIILGIETSCDDTSAGIVINGNDVMSNATFSQIKIHEKYGGVVPEIASRSHIDKISFVIDEALYLAKIGFDEVDAISVTTTPGLIGSLLVGISYARGIAFALNKPIIEVNHLEAHICANYIANCNFKPPFICLLVSGGNTNIFLVMDYLNFELLGSTRDDAAGEAYDKVARVLGFGYPGGQYIDENAQLGDKSLVKFPRAYLEENSLDFSFSGLKSSVLNYINKNNSQNIDFRVEDVCASFQESVVEVLVNKTIKACEMHNISKVAIAGGVSSNSGLRKSMKEACEQKGFELNIPDPKYCTDNGAMVGASGYFRYMESIGMEVEINKKA